MTNDIHRHKRNTPPNPLKKVHQESLGVCFKVCFSCLLGCWCGEGGCWGCVVLCFVVCIVYVIYVVVSFMCRSLFRGGVGCVGCVVWVVCVVGFMCCWGVGLCRCCCYYVDVVCVVYVVCVVDCVVVSLFVSLVSLRLCVVYMCYYMFANPQHNDVNKNEKPNTTPLKKVIGLCCLQTYNNKTNDVSDT